MAAPFTIPAVSGRKARASSRLPPAGCRDWEEGVLLSQGQTRGTAGSGRGARGHRGLRARHRCFSHMISSCKARPAARISRPWCSTSVSGAPSMCGALCDEGRMLPPNPPSRSSPSPHHRHGWPPARALPTGHRRLCWSGPGAPVTSPVDSDEGASEAGIAASMSSRPAGDGLRPTVSGFRCSPTPFCDHPGTPAGQFFATPSPDCALGLVSGRSFWSAPCPP